jgi:hypothetical protein
MEQYFIEQQNEAVSQTQLRNNQIPDSRHFDSYKSQSRKKKKSIRKDIQQACI